MKRWVVMLVASLVPWPVSAQETRSSWPAVAPPGGSTIYVRDSSGVETSGSLLRLSPDSVVLQVGGTERRFDADRVTRIQKRGDSLRNGAIVGAVVGVAIGVFVAGFADCPGARPDCPGSRATALLVSTGAYAAIGTGLDAAVRGRTTLYEAPASPTARRERSGAEAAEARAAVHLRVRW